MSNFNYRNFIVFVCNLVYFINRSSLFFRLSLFLSLSFFSDRGFFNLFDFFHLLNNFNFCRCCFGGSLIFCNSGYHFIFNTLPLSGFFSFLISLELSSSSFDGLLFLSLFVLFSSGDSVLFPLLFLEFSSTLFVFTFTLFSLSLSLVGLLLLLILSAHGLVPFKILVALVSLVYFVFLEFLINFLFVEVLVDADADYLVFVNDLDVLFGIRAVLLNNSHLISVKLDNFLIRIEFFLDGTGGFPALTSTASALVVASTTVVSTSATSLVSITLLEFSRLVASIGSSVVSSVSSLRLLSVRIVRVGAILRGIARSIGISLLISTALSSEVAATTTFLSSTFGIAFVVVVGWTRGSLLCRTGCTAFWLAAHN